jgi:hypothetical protein
VSKAEFNNVAKLCAGTFYKLTLSGAEDQSKLILQIAMWHEKFNKLFEDDHKQNRCQMANFVS